MKNIISIMMVAAIGMLLVFTGCKKEEYQTEPLKMVTLSGTVKAELNLSTAGLESVPNGTKIIFRIDSRDLVQTPIAGYTYQILQYETTVVDGTYTIQLPAVKFNAARVDITPVDFQTDQIQADNSRLEKTYIGNPSVEFIQEGERYFRNLTYSAI